MKEGNSTSKHPLLRPPLHLGALPPAALDCSHRALDDHWSALLNVNSVGDDSKQWQAVETMGAEAVAGAGAGGRGRGRGGGQGQGQGQGQRQGQGQGQGRGKQ